MIFVNIDNPVIRFVNHMSKYPQICFMTSLGSRCDGAQRGEMPSPPYKGGCPKDRGVGFKQLPNGNTKA